MQETDMWCADCESIDDYFFKTTWFWLFMPTTESVTKLTDMCKACGYSAEVTTSHCVKVIVHLGDIKSFLTQLNGCLDGPEFGQAKVTTTDSDSLSSLEAIGRMTTAEVLTRRFQARWLVEALDEHRYESWFQPIVHASGDLDAPSVFAHESLFRIFDESETMIPPGFAFSLAEQGELLFALDLTARRSAVEYFSRARLDGKVFINFNPSSIYDPAYCLRATASAIHELGLKPSDVVFEIVETHKASDMNHLKGILSFYRNSGFGVAIDDIGSGWSGLNLLEQLRPDYIKIDMELISGIDRNVYKQNIVKHLIEIARHNRIKVIAEGIETRQEANLLKEFGADFLQGYYFAKPKPFSDRVTATERENIKQSAKLVSPNLRG